MLFDQTHSEDSEHQGISNPLIYMAAQELINHHNHPKRRTADFAVEAFDLPHDALLSVAKQMDDFGTTHVLKNALLYALKDYIISKGGHFARAANAKPVYIAMKVAGEKPVFKFDDGVTEMAAIDGVSATVEGVPNVNISLTVSGTKMTSNNADIDAIFSRVKGNKLWIQFEAPTTSALDGMLNEQDVLRTGVVESIGAMVDAEGAEEIITQLQENDLFTDEMRDVLENIIELRTLVDGDITPDVELQIEALVDTITDSVSEGVSGDAMPVNMAAAISELLFIVSETYDLQNSIPSTVIDDLDLSIAEANIVSQLERVLEALNPATDSAMIEVVQHNIEEISGADKPKKIEVISEIKELFESAEFAPENLPENVIEAIAVMHDTLEQVVKSNSAEQSVVISSQPEPLNPDVAEAIEEIATIIETIKSMDDIPAELQTIIVSMNTGDFDLENMDAQTLAVAIQNEGVGGDLSKFVMEAVTLLKTPSVQVLLSQETLNQINNTLQKHEVVINVIAAKDLVAELQAIMDTADLNTDQTMALVNAIETLSEDPSAIQNIDVPELIQISETMDGETPASFAKAIEIATIIQSPKTVIATETIEVLSDAIEVVKAEAVDAPTLEALQDLETAIAELKEHNNIETAEAEIARILQNPDLPVQIQDVLKTVVVPAIEPVSAAITLTNMQADVITHQIEEAVKSSNLDAPDSAHAEAILTKVTNGQPVTSAEITFVKEIAETMPVQIAHALDIVTERVTMNVETPPVIESDVPFPSDNGNDTQLDVIRATVEIEAMAAQEVPVQNIIHPDFSANLETLKAQLPADYNTISKPLDPVVKIAVNSVIDVSDTSKAQPTIRNVVQTVQQINAAMETQSAPPQVRASLNVIKSQIMQSIPAQQRKAIQPLLNISHLNQRSGEVQLSDNVQIVADKVVVYSDDGTGARVYQQSELTNEVLQSLVKPSQSDAIPQNSVTQAAPQRSFKQAAPQLNHNEVVSVPNANVARETPAIGKTTQPLKPSNVYHNAVNSNVQNTVLPAIEVQALAQFDLADNVQIIQDKVVVYNDDGTGAQVLSQNDITVDKLQSFFKAPLSPDDMTKILPEITFSEQNGVTIDDPCNGCAGDKGCCSAFNSSVMKEIAENNGDVTLSFGDAPSNVATLHVTNIVSPSGINEGVSTTSTQAEVTINDPCIGCAGDKGCCDIFNDTVMKALAEQNGDVDITFGEPASESENPHLVRAAALKPAA